MKNRGILDKTMHFLVHNSFLFTVAIMCLVHATLLVIMLFEDVMPLVHFNVLSVVVYLFCVLLCRFGHIMPVYVSIILEVAIYTVIATYYVGWDSGSFCFLCSTIPIIIYFGAFLFKGNQRWIIVLVLLLNFTIYVSMYTMLFDAQPVYELSHTGRSVLLIFASAVAVFAVIFYNMIYIYSSETERTSLERENKQLSVDAKEDVLTNVLNRRGFIPMMEKMMESPETSNFCIAFCDIDNFKRVNDSFGHDCGDEVLRHITKIIKNEVTGCPICRWGGEEIVILLKDYDMAVAKEKMEYLRKCIETNPTVFFNKRINVTVTIGLVENSEKYSNPEEIIKVADERMYYGKEHGKNILIYKEI